MRPSCGKGFEADLETLAAHPHPQDGFAGMEIQGDILTDKEYRKAGYSKKFRQEHEEEILILLHQAAKNAFDDMGVKKLPKVKELQAEYAKLLQAAGGKEENLR